MTRTVARLVDLIVRSCDPDEVVLFGSHAKGLAGRDSDLDVLVIGPFRQSIYLRAQEIEDLVADFPIRVDLHLLRPDELDDNRHPHSFLNSIRMHGVSLYTRQAGLAPIHPA
jgi:predicted nucleotidyltransferase